MNTFLRFLYEFLSQFFSGIIILFTMFPLSSFPFSFTVVLNFDKDVCFFTVTGSFTVFSISFSIIPPQTSASGSGSTIKHGFPEVDIPGSMIASKLIMPAGIVNLQPRAFPDFVSGNPRL